MKPSVVAALPAAATYQYHTTSVVRSRSHNTGQPKTARRSKLGCTLNRRTIELGVGNDRGPVPTRSLNERKTIRSSELLIDYSSGVVLLMTSNANRNAGKSSPG